MTAQTIKLVAFDLDDTLAPSKSPLPDEMGQALLDLMRHVPVLIISGGNFEQFQKQVIGRLPADERVAQLHLMPTNGTRYYRNNGGTWEEVYNHVLSEENRQRCFVALEAQAKELGFWEEHVWGPRIEDRGSQVTFSALGQEAPVAAKKAWDPDGAKRQQLRAAVQPLLPDLDVHAGGSTSIDITKKGVDKALGITNICQYLGLRPVDIMFVGDRLMPGGNDYPVIATGVQIHPVSDWPETLDYVRGLISTL